MGYGTCCLSADGHIKENLLGYFALRVYDCVSGGVELFRNRKRELLECGPTFSEESANRRMETRMLFDFPQTILR
jgi:hypothetical protein